MFRLLAVAALLYVVFKIFRVFFKKSALDVLRGPPPDSWITGNLLSLFARDGWGYFRDFTAKYGGAVRLHGMFKKDMVYVSDPLALYHITVKEQHIYAETRDFIVGNSMSFGRGLLATEGNEHRKQRKILNPVFSTAHMRNIVGIVHPIVHKLRDAISYHVQDGEKELDMLYWLSRLALELIGQAGFGYSFDELKPTTDSHNQYTQAVKQFTNANVPLVLFRSFLPFLGLFPRRMLRILGRALPFPALHKVMDIVDIMHDTSVEVYNQKKKAFGEGEKSVGEQLGGGKDIMSVLMRYNSTAAEEDRLSEDELLGQMNTFIFAGSDTTSSALSKILYLLSQNLAVQARLREEVTEARRMYGDLDYDQLVNLPYLDAVCRETLRFDPPVTMLLRDTTQDTILPLRTPVKSANGKDELTELALEKGTLIVVGIESFNRDKTLWGPDADKWKPERWLQPLPETVTDEHAPGIFSYMMTFFGGSRACIGLKFSQLEMKAVLSILMENFEFRLGDQEIEFLMTGIQVPAVKGQNDDVPRMPMKVSLVQKTS